MSQQSAGSRKFWIIVGVGALALVLMVALWVVPTLLASRDAEVQWAKETADLDRLRMLAKDIPSTRSVQEWKEYREWLDKQGQFVQNYFVDRSTLLTESLAGQGEVSAVAFKEAYIQAVRAQQRWLEQNKDRMAVPDLRTAYESPAWATGATLPKPEEYPNVLRGYWARKALYSIFFAADVKAVRKLMVGQQLVPLGSDFSGLPIECELLLPPDKIATVVESLLTVSSRMPDRPIMSISEMLVKPDTEGTKPMCIIQIKGNVLMLNSAPAGGKP